MLTLQYMPYGEIEQLQSEERVRKILSVVKKNRIVLLEGKLEREEETELIKQTMESISESFKGIELGAINPTERGDAAFIQKLKKNMATLLMGNRQGMTIIGPASIVRQIKQDPEKIQVFTDVGKRRR